MKLIKIFGLIAMFFLIATTPAFAVDNAEITTFTNNTLNTLIILATLASTLFLIKGGYSYITSSGKPDSLEHAKITIRNAALGLILVLGAGLISTIMSHAFSTPTGNFTAGQIDLTPIQPATPSNGLTQVLLDAIAAFLQNIVQSATKPLTTGIISFLTTTPTLSANSVIFNFWLVILGITDSLFALVVALLGFHLMSASTFGFDEIEFKHLLPRVGLAFFGANTSIFLADFIISTCNAMVQALLHATGGINQAWILNAFDPASLVLGTTQIITLIFMIIFVILAVVLLLFYITRLIILSLGAVLAPLIFLLWVIPKFSDFAEISIKTYLIAVFTVFVHLVIIQLASAFLTIPGQAGTNSLISILIAIGLLLTLLKTPNLLMQLVFYNSGRNIVKKVGGQIMNVMTSEKGRQDSTSRTGVKTPRKAVAL